MIYRLFGSTGVEVSALGFGGMRFQAPQRTEEMADLVLHAFEKGINYFDTAPYYCEDQSEKIVGLAVNEIKKSGKAFYTASKCGSADPAIIRKTCERSLQRLHVDAIDFYHVWCLIHPQEFSARKAQGAMDEFIRLKEEGLVRHLCVSSHLEYDHLKHMLEESDGLFEGLLIGVCALNYDLRAAGIKEAMKRGMGVVTMNTLGGGLLTGHPEHFQYLIRDRAPTLVDAALQFNLSIPGVTCALVGFRNKKDIDSAIEAMERLSLMQEDELEGIRQKTPGQELAFCTRCGYCRDCPEGIPVVRLMDTHNVLILEGRKVAKEHLQYHWGISDLPAKLQSCTECRQCETACTQQLPILDRFQQLKSAL